MPPFVTCISCIVFRMILEGLDVDFNIVPIISFALLNEKTINKQKAPSLTLISGGAFIISNIDPVFKKLS